MTTAADDLERRVDAIEDARDEPVSGAEMDGRAADEASR